MRFIGGNVFIVPKGYFCFHPLVPVDWAPYNLFVSLRLLSDDWLTLVDQENIIKCILVKICVRWSFASYMCSANTNIEADV